MNTMTFRFGVALGVLLGAVMMVASPLLAAQYTLTVLGTMEGGSTSIGVGVNNSGQVTGRGNSYYSTGTRSFLYDNGTVSDIEGIGTRSSQGEAINNNGQIIGSNNGDEQPFLWENDVKTVLNVSSLYGEGRDLNDFGSATGFASNPDTGSPSAFLYENGNVHDLGTLDGTGWSEGRGINNSGQVVGTNATSLNEVRGFIYNDGTMTSLGTLQGGTYSEASSINNSGQVTGVSATNFGSGTRAYIWENDIMTNLGVLYDGYHSEGFDIDDSGQVVGFSAGIGAKAFIWNSTEGMLDLNLLIDPDDPLYGQFNLIRALGISDNGKYITGYGRMQGSDDLAFRLELVSVVPIPASLPLFLTGLAGLGYLRRRKRIARSKTVH